MLELIYGNSAEEIGVFCDEPTSSLHAIARVGLLVESAARADEPVCPSLHAQAPGGSGSFEITRHANPSAAFFHGSLGRRWRQALLCLDGWGRDGRQSDDTTNQRQIGPAADQVSPEHFSS